MVDFVIFANTNNKERERKSRMENGEWRMEDGGVGLQKGLYHYCATHSTYIYTHLFVNVHNLWEA